MSNQEHIKGKLLIVESKGSIEDTCLWMLNELGHEVEDSDGYTYEDQLLDEYSSEYVVYEDDLYKILTAWDAEPVDIFNASLDLDGTIDFEVCYYNGGCGFNEAVGYALEKLEKES